MLRRDAKKLCCNLIAIQFSVTKLLSKNLLTRVMKCIVGCCQNTLRQLETKCVSGHGKKSKTCFAAKRNNIFRSRQCFQIAQIYFKNQD